MSEVREYAMIQQTITDQAQLIISSKQLLERLNRIATKAINSDGTDNAHKTKDIGHLMMMTTSTHSSAYLKIAGIVLGL